MNARPPAAVRVHDGVCHVCFAFDAGHSIDLERALRQLTRASSAQPSLFKLSRRAPATLQFKTPPLRLMMPLEPRTIPAATTESIGAAEQCGATFHTDPLIEAAIYDFGAVSVQFRVPLTDLTLDALLHLAASLYDAPDLLQAARSAVEQLMNELGAAIHQPQLSETVEDFAIYLIRGWTCDDDPHAEPATTNTCASGLLAHRQVLAQILRGEPQLLSDSEVEEAIGARLSYGRNDMTLVDWNAALVFDPQADDTLTVLSYANVELLEMRFLDDMLDQILDRAYARLSRPPWRGLRSSRGERRRLAALQMDSALLFEGINNAIKLVGDQYLARVYNLAARRFHLPDWDASVLRKIETLQQLYEKVADQQAARRMEILEWIIIILIAVSIVLPFVPLS